MEKFSNKEIKLFKKYTQLIGVSGDEHIIAKNLIEDYKKMGYEPLKDNLGNIFACKKSKDPKFNVLICGHMDEVGFIVNKITPLGLIKVMPVGGAYLSLANGTRATLKTNKGKLFKGCLYSTNGIETSDDILFDFGFSSYEDASKNISYGDTIVIDGELTMLNNNQRMMSKAIDDKYGIVLGLEILDYFKDKELPFNLFVGGTTQEEVGLRGASLLKEEFNPDIAIVLDCSNALDYKGKEGKLGKGVLLRYFDRAMISFEELISLQEKACKKAKVNSQYFQTMGGTDAGKIHLSNEGCMTLTHCIVGRNIHTGITIIDANDYHSSKKSLITLLKMLDFKTFEKLKSWRR